MAEVGEEGEDDDADDFLHLHFTGPALGLSAAVIYRTALTDTVAQEAKRRGVCRCGVDRYYYIIPATKDVLI